MSYRFLLSCGVLVLSLGALIAVPVRPPAPPDFRGLKPESIKTWGGTEVPVVGNFTKVIDGPVGRSFPPLSTFTLEVTPPKVLRGPTNLDKVTTAKHSARQENPPAFPKDESLIGLRFVQGNWVLQSFDEATPA